MQQLYNFHAVGNRIGVVPSAWGLSIENENQILELIKKAGFRFLSVNPYQLARNQRGKSIYKRQISLLEAPDIFNCTTFVRWIYAQMGIELNVYAIDESKQGISINITELMAGDLVFSKGRLPQYEDDISKGIGHAGVVTEQGTVLHVTNIDKAHYPDIIRETTLEIFYRSPDNYRGARRILPQSGFYVLEIPHGRDVLWSHDVRRMVMKYL